MTKHSEHLERWGLIGDLDGSWDNLVEHLSQLKIIDEQKKISGKVHSILFYGDILADRVQEGFDILEFLSKLGIHLQEQGHELTILAGNHEELMFSFLTGYYEALGGITDIDTLIENSNPAQFHGILELLPYGKHYHEILKNMQADSRGYLLLQKITQMKLGKIIGDTIHFHTPPSRIMLDILMQSYTRNQDVVPHQTLMRINTIWQQSLRNLLLGKSVTPEKRISALQAYGTLATTFLHTLNGSERGIKERGCNIDDHQEQITPFDHPFYRALSDSGIDHIYHVHTDDELKAEGIDIHGLNRKCGILEVTQGEY